jgi:hypothetical protein
VGGAQVDPYCQLAETPRWLAALVGQWWTLFGEPGRASYWDAPDWCLEVGELIQEIQAEQAARARDARRQKEIAAQYGLR